MSILSGGKVAKIEFCEVHNPIWAENAVALGTTPATITSLITLTTTAREAYLAQQTASAAAKDATASFALAVAAMTNAAAEVIKQIKVKAGISGDSIYTLASIPAPAIPGPIGELGTPRSFKAGLEVTGAVVVSWKCTNPKSATGTVYTVYRRIGGAGPFQYIGGTGSKKFVDATLPAGADQVQYQVQAVRSTSVGPFAQFNVNFGVGGGTTVTQILPAKFAA